MGELFSKHKNQKGFTLIEIVLVLAIAGLIFTIVFLAVQGANRGRRDTDRRAAAARLLAAAEQIASNSSGAYPVSCTSPASFADGTAPDAYNNQAGTYPCSTTVEPNGTTGLNIIRYARGNDCGTGVGNNFVRARFWSEVTSTVQCLSNN